MTNQPDDVSEPPEQRRESKSLRESISLSIAASASDINSHEQPTEVNSHTSVDELNNWLSSIHREPIKGTKFDRETEIVEYSRTSAIIPYVQLAASSSTYAPPATASATKLAPRERELLIKKNRKLAQIFGPESSLPNLRSPRKDLIFPSQVHNIQISNEQIFLSPLVPTAESSYLENQEVIPSDSFTSSDMLYRASDDEIETSADQGKSFSIPASVAIETIAERRRKIAQLAKLHRYLGSGVPAERVFGITEFMRDLDLPRHTDEFDGGSNSLVAPEASDTDSPRMSNSERAAKVKRASKIEKVSLFIIMVIIFANTISLIFFHKALRRPSPSRASSNAVCTFSSSQYLKEWGK
jgi:hypothetical protein